MKWRNWSASVEFEASEILYPRSEAEIIQIVERARQAGLMVRVVGSGHSFTPLVVTDAILMSLDHWQGLIRVDTSRQEVTVRAGTKIHALHELLYEQGFSQENLGDIDVQSIAGAISTGTHGTGASLGSISTQVTALRLVTGTGEILNCSESENRDLFKAAQVSLGALGIITEVTLRCLPRYKLHLQWRKGSLSDCLANYEQYKAENRHFEFFWIPHTDAVMMKFMNMSDAEVRGTNLFRQFNETVLENAALYLLMEASRFFPKISKKVAQTIGSLITGGEDVQYAHKVFASTRLVRFQEMEYNVPVEHFVTVMRELEALFQSGQHDSIAFPIECRFVRRDDIFLSPAYEREAAYIAVHEYKGKPYRAYFDAAEAIFKRYEGRPHWGKMHSRQAADLRPAYPQWAAFQTARQQLDPDGVFMNAYLKTLFG